MLDAQKRLQEADRRYHRVADAIGRQKRRIAEMQKGGYSAAGSIMLLREMEVSLNSMRGERNVIERRIERHPEDDPGNEISSYGFSKALSVDRT